MCVFVQGLMVQRCSKCLYLPFCLELSSFQAWFPEMPQSAAESRRPFVGLKSRYTPGFTMVKDFMSLKRGCLHVNKLGRTVFPAKDWLLPRLILHSLSKKGEGFYCKMINCGLDGKLWLVFASACHCFHLRWRLDDPTQELVEDTSEFFVETLKAAFADRQLPICAVLTTVLNWDYIYDISECMHKPPRLFMTLHLEVRVDTIFLSCF